MYYELDFYTIDIFCYLNLFDYLANNFFNSFVFIGVGFVGLIINMSAKRIGEKLLDIGSKVGGIVGAGAAIEQTIRGRKSDKTNSNGDSDKDKNTNSSDEGKKNNDNISSKL